MVFFIPKAGRPVPANHTPLVFTYDVAAVTLFYLLTPLAAGEPSAHVNRHLLPTTLQHLGHPRKRGR